MIRIIIIWVFLVTSGAYGQSNSKDSILRIIDNRWVSCDSFYNLRQSDKYFTICEYMPTFPGGDSELVSFIKKNKRNCKASGRVYAAFIVDTVGIVRCARIIKGISSECDNEAIRILELMPNWKPGSQRGKSIYVELSIPIEF